MIFEDPEDPHPPNDEARGIAIAVVTAALTCLVTGLVTWWLDDLRDRYGRKPPTKPEKDKPEKDK